MYVVKPMKIQGNIMPLREEPMKM